MFYENLRINMPRDLSCCLLFFTIFGLGKKNSPYFPFHNVGRSDIGYMIMTDAKYHSEIKRIRGPTPWVPRCSSTLKNLWYYEDSQI